MLISNACGRPREIIPASLLGRRSTARGIRPRLPSKCHRTRDPADRRAAEPRPNARDARPNTGPTGAPIRARRAPTSTRARPRCHPHASASAHGVPASPRTVYQHHRPSRACISATPTVPPARLPCLHRPRTLVPASPPIACVHVRHPHGATHTRPPIACLHVPATNRQRLVAHAMHSHPPRCHPHASASAHGVPACPRTLYPPIACVHVRHPHGGTRTPPPIACLHVPSGEIRARALMLVMFMPPPYTSVPGIFSFVYVPRPPSDRPAVTDPQNTWHPIAAGPQQVCVMARLPTHAHLPSATALRSPQPVCILPSACTVLRGTAGRSA